MIANPPIRPLPEEPLVSVVIPTHNRADMLRRALSSVLKQSYRNLEILVVSDNSQDHTETVIEYFADERIRFFKHSSSRGASAARNTALENARGEYIAFLDDDDEWVSHKLSTQIPVIMDSGADVGLVYAWMAYIRAGQLVGVRAPCLRGNVFLQMLEKQAIGGCPTVVIKRQVIDRVGYFDENLPRGNDGDYWRRVSRHFAVDYVPMVLARVHIGHQDRISVESRASIENRIKAKLARLTKFPDDFADNPEIHCRFLVQIATKQLRLRNTRDCLLWLRKARAVSPSTGFFIRTAGGGVAREFLPSRLFS